MGVSSRRNAYFGINCVHSLETSFCQKRQSTPEPFLCQNERFVETKRKHRESTPEIRHFRALIYSPKVCSSNFIFRWPTSTCLRTGVEEEDCAINSSANVWDDGTIDPRNTRDTLLKCLEVFEFTAHHKRHIMANEGITNYQPVYRL